MKERIKKFKEKRDRMTPKQVEIFSSIFWLSSVAILCLIGFLIYTYGK